jgi:hypothetical protein
MMHVFNLNIDKEGKFNVRIISGSQNMWSIPKGERIVVEFDGIGQPVGFSGQKLCRCAGYYVRNSGIVGIDKPTWRQVPNDRKEEIWNMLMVSV